MGTQGDTTYWLYNIGCLYTEHAEGDLNLLVVYIRRYNLLIVYIIKEI